MQQKLWGKKLKRKIADGLLEQKESFWNILRMYPINSKAHFMNKITLLYQS